MTRGLAAALACAAVMVSAGQAAAATITVEQTLTGGSLSNIAGAPPPTYSPTFGAPATVGSFTAPAQYLNLGDTLDWTLHLAPGDQISFSGLHSLFAETGVLMLGSIDVQSHGSVSLLDSLGHVVFAGSSNTTPYGGYAVAYSPTSSPIDVSFSTIHAIITLDSFSNSSLGLDPTGAYFIEPKFGWNADSATFPAYAVPEPSAWILLLLGVAALGAALRRRRGLRREWRARQDSNLQPSA